MTVTSWSDASKALVGALYGTPEAHAAAEKADLERRRVDLEEKRYGLEESLNPLKMKQLEAAAAKDFLDRDLAARTLKSREYLLNDVFKNMSPTPAAAPQTPNTAPSDDVVAMLMPHLVQQESSGNPMALSPKGAGGLTQIMPATARDPGFGVKPLQGWDGVDPRTASEAEQIRFGQDYLRAQIANRGGDIAEGLAAYNAGPGAVAKYDGIPPYAETQQYVKNITKNAGLTPQTTSTSPQASPFDHLINNLTAPEQQTATASTQAPPLQNQDLMSLLTPQIMTMIDAGYIKPENLGDMMLALEGMQQAQNTVEPSQRLAKYAQGAGDPWSEDQLLADALGGNRSPQELASIAETEKLPASVQEFRAGQQDPKLMDYLTQKNAGESFTVTNPDGTVVSYGKQGKTGRVNEWQAKFGVAANQLAKPVSVLEGFNKEKYVMSASDYIIRNTLMDNPIGALVGVQAMSPKSQQFFQALRPVVAQAIFIQSGQAATEQEVNRKTVELMTVPGEDPAVTDAKWQSIKMLGDTVTGLAGPALQGTPLGGETAVNSQESAPPSTTGGFKILSVRPSGGQ